MRPQVREPTSALRHDRASRARACCAGLVAAAFLATLGEACKHGKESAGTPIADASAPTVLRAAPSPTPPPSATAAASSTPKAAPSGSVHEPGRTAEAIVDEARAHVTEAVKLSASKDPCPAVLPLLDVSYVMTRGSVPVEERVLGTFAECAAHHQRWRLLRALADAIAAGERKLETTYFLPRALIGEGSYEPANTLAKATLRAWPTEGEAYDTAALAALRVKDWDAAVKAADQALLLLRKHNVTNEVTALAHGVRGAALLRLGKTEEGVHEVESGKAHEGALRITDVTLEAARATKASGLLASLDIPATAYPALWPLYVKKVAPLSGLVTVTLQSAADHPLPVLVEVAVDGAETAAESETLQKGKAITLALTPALKSGGPLSALTAPEAREVSVTVSGGVNHAVIYHEAHKVTFEPPEAMPKVLRAHTEDLRSAFALEAGWVTPKEPSILALVDAAKSRVKGGASKLEGAAGPTLPQVQALWDELRSRGVSFHRDPQIDTETDESVPCRLPSVVLAAGEGNALESSVLFASLLEAIGLDVILVEMPGHRMVGWVATPADLAANQAALQTVKTARGQAYFLETTTVGEGPFDAAVLRGDAQWVAASNDGSVSSGTVQIEAVTELRKRGVTPRAPAP